MQTSLIDSIVPKRRFMIAEDDPDDQLLIRDALEQNGISEQDISFVDDGQELLLALERGGQNPDVILLDLNMPRVDGRQALKEIKSNEALKHIPVIIFTTSSSEEDVRLTYQTGGNTFFTKPSSFDDLVSTMALIKLYWTETAVLAEMP